MKLERICTLTMEITEAEDTKQESRMSEQAFSKARSHFNHWPYLGMKLCVGCWLEGGDAFGNVLDNIKYFVENKRVFAVHFRNVSSTLPNFEEILLEDGYADMYEIIAVCSVRL